MRYLLYRIDAFTGHILHPDGSGRAQCVGDKGFEEAFESRDEALARKAELLRCSGITEILVAAEDWSESLTFQNAEEIERLRLTRSVASLRGRR